MHLVKQALISPVKWLDIARAHVVGLCACFIVFTSAYCLKLVLNCLVVGKGALLHSKSRLTFSLQLLLWYNTKPSTLKTLLANSRPEPQETVNWPITLANAYGNADALALLIPKKAGILLTSMHAHYPPTGKGHCE